MPDLGEKEDIVIGERDVGGGHVADALHRSPILVRQILLDAARRERKRACHEERKTCSAVGNSDWETLEIEAPWC